MCSIRIGYNVGEEHSDRMSIRNIRSKGTIGENEVVLIIMVNGTAGLLYVGQYISNPSIRFQSFLNHLATQTTRLFD